MKVYTKVIFVQLSILIIVMAIFGVIQSTIANNESTGLLVEKGQILITRFPSAVIDPIWNLDYDEVKNLIDLELLDKDVIAIIVDASGDKIGRIMDDNGDIIDYQEGDSYPQLDSAFTTINGEILRKEKPLGSVDVYLTDFRILNEKKQQTIQTIIQSLIMVIVLGVSIFLVLLNLLNKPLSIVQHSIEEISEGDLTNEIVSSSEDELGKLLDAMNNMKEKLFEIVSSVVNGSEQIVSASTQLSEGNQDLAMRTEQQATALEETSTAIDEMNSSIRSNADNTTTANQLSNDVSVKTDEGTIAVSNVIDSMKDISNSSNRISDIIDVINNIAFQTNLLALNASIEAARAGEMGKGFAVVAVEVRKLAKRSDKAAAEISGIIKESNKKVDDGVVLANNAGDMLNEINGAVKKVTALIAEISASSQEQLSSVDQIDKTLSSLDENTQKNASLVEEASASTEELSAQAQELSDTMKFFKLGNKKRSLLKVKPAIDKPLYKEKNRSSVIVDTPQKTDQSETYSEVFDESEFKEF